MEDPRIEGTFGVSVATLDEAMKRFGQHPTLQYQLAKRLAGSNRYDDAIKQLNRLVAKDSTQTGIWRLLAHVYRAKGMPREGAYALSPIVVLGEATPEEKTQAAQLCSDSGVGAPFGGGCDCWRRCSSSATNED